MYNTKVGCNHSCQSASSTASLTIFIRIFKVTMICTEMTLLRSFEGLTPICLDSDERQWRPLVLSINYKTQHYWILYHVIIDIIWTTKIYKQLRMSYINLKKNYSHLRVSSVIGKKFVPARSFHTHTFEILSRISWIFEMYNFLNYTFLVNFQSFNVN